jgi:hypothetical protein
MPWCEKCGEYTKFPDDKGRCIACTVDRKGKPIRRDPRPGANLREMRNDCTGDDYSEESSPL